MDSHGFFKGLLFTVLIHLLHVLYICEVLPILYCVTCGCLVVSSVALHSLQVLIERQKISMGGILSCTPALKGTKM